MSIQFPMPSSTTRRHRSLGRACAGILLVCIIAIWLAALPGLLPRDGFAMRGDGCLLSAYRDPVSGRSAPVRKFYRDMSDRGMARGSCDAASSVR